MHGVNLQHSFSNEDDEKILRIKINCVATTILNETRNLTWEKKKKVKRFCDQLVFEANSRPDDPDYIPEILDQNRGTDQLRVASVANLKFDETGKSILESFYKNAKEYEGGLQAYFLQILNNIIMSDDDDKKLLGSVGKSNSLAQIMGLGIEDHYGLREIQSIHTDPKEVFGKIVKAFEHVNFYNVLI